MRNIIDWTSKITSSSVWGLLWSLKKSIHFRELWAWELEIDQAFQELESYIVSWEFQKSESEINKKAQEVEKKIKSWLVKSWVARPILALDWAINRTREAEKCLWLPNKGGNKLQEVLARKYNFQAPRHLHKGPGNGAYPRELATDNPEWSQISIGDRLYFNIDDILQKYIHPKYQNDPVKREFFQKILIPILKLKLREKWFGGDPDKIKKWELQDERDFPDLNDIYTLLHEIPQTFEWDLQKIYDLEKARLKQSIIFEHDSDELISWDLATFLDTFFSPGKSLKNFALMQINHELQKKLQVLDVFILKEGWYTQQEKEQLQKLFPDTFSFRWPQDKQIAQKLRDKIHVDRLNAQTLHHNAWQKDSLASIEEFMSGFFRDDFYENQKDLNEEIDVYFENFHQGYFTDIPQVLWEDESFELIISTRGDSHENDEQFQQDIYQNLQALSPGWVLLTDGIRQSYSNYYRFDAIDAAVKAARWEFSVDYIRDISWNIKSVLIQKSHPNWYLNDEEKTEIFWEAVSFVTRQDCESDSFFRLEQDIKKQVLDQTQGDTHVFKNNNVRQILIEQYADMLLEGEHFQKEKEEFENAHHSLIGDFLWVLKNKESPGEYINEILWNKVSLNKELKEQIARAIKNKDLSWNSFLASVMYGHWEKILMQRELTEDTQQSYGRVCMSRGDFKKVYRDAALSVAKVILRDKSEIEGTEYLVQASVKQIMSRVA